MILKFKNYNSDIHNLALATAILFLAPFAIGLSIYSGNPNFTNNINIATICISIEIFSILVSWITRN